MRHAITAALLCLILPAAGLAEERATTKEAEVMVHKAVEYMKTNGQEKALAAYNDPKGPFAFRDLYIMSMDLEGTIKAHPIRKDFVGKNHLNFKDADGKAFNQELLATAKAKGKGWVEYKMKNPANDKVERKVAYFEAVDGVVVLCGAFLK